jgi:NAD kinase
MSAGARRLARVVVVTRPTPLEQLIARYGTYAQAKFCLASTGEQIDWYEATHERLESGLGRALQGIPQDRPYTRIDRADLDRFLFAPDDLVMIVGQDGLVANVAKYLDGQLTIGVNPDPARYDGVLCRHAPEHVEALTSVTITGDARWRVEARVLAEARCDDGQRLLALNEIFIGHISHQSARYRLSANRSEERHSSSGVIVATGTGATGWARSIVKQRALELAMPKVDEPRLAWFVREPWPSVATAASLDVGIVDADTPLSIASEMSEGGVIFADGIESDRIDFVSGRRVTLRVADRRLNLVVPVEQPVR